MINVWVKRNIRRQNWPWYDVCSLYKMDPGGWHEAELDESRVFVGPTRGYWRLEDFEVSFIYPIDMKLEDLI